MQEQLNFPEWTRSQRPLLTQCAEVLSKSRNEATFIGPDIEGTISPACLEPGQGGVVTLRIPDTYFSTLPSGPTEEEMPLLILALLAGGLYSDRSRIAQAGGATSFAGLSQGQIPKPIGEIVIPSADGSAWEVQVNMTNYNPVRAMQFPESNFEYLRLLIPGSAVRGPELYNVASEMSVGAECEVLDKNGSVTTDANSAYCIRIAIAQFAEYEANESPINVSLLDSGNRTELDEGIGLNWEKNTNQSTKLSVDTSEVRMVIGSTGGSVKMPRGYIGRIVSGMEPGELTHQRSTLVDSEYEGDIRTEHTVRGDGRPKYIELTIYKV
ncbi:hypothetical protein KBB12_03380 [Candidatus Woesebacteria bacterium]|nr:hypothetical protein [Candidatus Woesebacteria bacterium]